jgi:uncharacterized protein YjbJ (UPF0337 family)
MGSAIVSATVKLWSCTCTRTAERAAILSPAPKQGGRIKQSTKDQLNGSLHESKGNPGLEAEGRDEKTAGKVQKKFGQIEKVFDQ